MARKLSTIVLLPALLAALALGPRDLPGATFRRGDVDGNAVTDMTDAIRMLGFLFRGGAVPGCLDAADANDSGKVDVSDAAYLLGYLFRGGKAPPDPFRDCGVDPTQDGLDCRESKACGSGPADPAPVISGFAPDVNRLAAPSGEGVFLVHLAFSYSDPQSDIESIVVTTLPPGGKAQLTESAAASFGIDGASGKASYQASFHSRSAIGVHEFRVRLVDAEGNQSAEASTKIELTAGGTPRLEIASMTPVSGAAGDVLTLSGTGLDASSIDRTAVSVGGVRAAIRKITGGRILCEVPDGALTGPVIVSSSRGVARSATSFVAVPSIAIADDGKQTLLPLETRTLHAEVSGLVDRSVHWLVNGIAGGSPAVGTIDKTGLYTAPASPPAEGGVTVRAIPFASDALSAELWLGLAPVEPMLGAGVLNARTGGRIESRSGIASLELAPGALKGDLKVARLEARFADTQDALPGVPAKSIALAVVELEVSSKPSMTKPASWKALLPMWTPPKTELAVYAFNGKTFVDAGWRATTDSSGTIAIGELPSLAAFVVVREPNAILVTPPDLFPKPQVESVTVPVDPDGIEEGLTLPVLVRGKNFWQSFTRVRPVDPALSQDLEIGSVLVNPEGTQLGFTVRIHPMPGLRAGHSLPVPFRIERLSASNQVTGQVDTDGNDFVIRGLNELIVSADPQSNVYTIDGLHIDRLINDSQRFSTIVVDRGAVLAIGDRVGNVFTDDGMTHDLSSVDAFEAAFGRLAWVADRGLNRASVRIFQPENSLIWLEATGPVEIDGIVHFGGMRGGENAALDHSSGPGIARLGGVANGGLSGGMGGDGGVTISGQTANGHSAGNGVTERGVGHGAHGIADAQASVAGFGARFDPQVVELEGFVEEAISAFNPFSPPTDLIEAALRIGKLTLAAADLGTTAAVNHDAPENIVAGAGGHGGRRASGQSRQMVDDSSIEPGSGGGGGGGGGSTSAMETLFGVTLTSEAAKGGAGAGGGGAAGSLRITTSSLFRIGPSGRLDGPGGRGGFGEPHQWTGSPGGGGGGGSGGVAKLQGSRFFNEGKIDVSGGERAGAVTAQSSSPPPNGGNGRLQALNGSARGGFIYYGCRCPYLSVASPTVILCWPTGRKRADLTFPVSGILGIGSATNVPWFPFLPPARAGLLILDDHKKVWFTSLPDFLAQDPAPSVSAMLVDLIASPPMSGFTPTDIAQSPFAPFHYFVSGVRGALNAATATSEVLEYDESFQFVATVFSRQTAEILGGSGMLGHLSDIDFLSDGRLIGMMAAMGPIETGIHEIDVQSGTSAPLLDLPEFEPTILRSISVIRGPEDQILASLGTTGLATGVKVYTLSGAAAHAAMVIETISSPGEPGLLRADGGLPGSNAPRVAFDGMEVPDPRYEPSTFSAPAIGSFAAPAGSATALESLVFGGARINLYCQGAERGLSSAIWKTSDVSPTTALPAPPADGLGQIHAVSQIDEGFNTLWIETNVGGTTHELLRRPVLYIKNANVYAPRGD